MATIEITEPFLRQPTYYPLCLSRGPAIVNRTRVAGHKNQFIAPNSLILEKMATHIMVTGGHDSNVPHEYKFSLSKMGTAGVNIHSDPSAFNMAGRNYAAATGNSKGLVHSSELAEEIGNHGASDVRTKTNEYHKGYTHAIMEQHGIPFGEVKSYGEYGEVNVGGLGRPGNVYGNPTKLAAYRNALSSQENARKNYNPGNDGFDSVNFKYWAAGMDSCHNFTHRAYYGSLGNLGGNYIAELNFGFERVALGSPDRSQALFGWNKVQDLIRLPHNYLDITDGWTYKFNNPPGRLYIGNNPLSVAPPHILEWVVFYSNLYGVDVLIWDDMNGVKDTPIEGFQRDIFGGYDDGVNWYTKGYQRHWIPEGGTPVSYDPNDPSHPRHYNAPGVQGGFSKYPFTTNDAAVAGRWKWEQIAPYLSQVEYASFSTDGGSTFYTPTPGSNGVRISTYLAPNYNSANPVLDAPANRQPHAHISSTSAGTVCIYLDPYSTPDVHKNVVFRRGGVDYNMGSCQGCKLIIKVFT